MKTLHCFEHKNGFQKIVNLLDATSGDKYLPRFVTKKWIEVYDQSGRDYRVNKETRIKKPVLRPDLCDFSDAYVVVEETVTFVKKTFVANDFMDLAENRRAASTTTSNTVNDVALDGRLTFKSNALFVNCISKINDVLIDNTEDLDVVMPMYNLLEYSKSYTTEKQQGLCRIITEMNQTVVLEGI